MSPVKKLASRKKESTVKNKLLLEASPSQLEAVVTQAALAQQEAAMMQAVPAQQEASAM